MNFDGDTLWAAFGLMLVFEGILPFVTPQGWRNRMTQLLVLEDGQIRFFWTGLRVGWTIDALVAELRAFSPVKSRF